MANLIDAWNEILEREKKLKRMKEDLRAEILKVLEQRETLQPIITVDIPEEYFLTTGQSYAEFVESRFPDWTCEDIVTDEIVTLTLKKKPQFTSGLIEVEGTDTALAKTVVEYSPEIDTETLMLEDPELFDRIFEEERSWVINEEALEQEVITNPDIYAVLRRHSKVKMPSIKILVKKVKDD